MDARNVCHRGPDPLGEAYSRVPSVPCRGRRGRGEGVGAGLRRRRACVGGESSPPAPGGGLAGSTRDRVRLGRRDDRPDHDPRRVGSSKTGCRSTNLWTGRQQSRRSVIRLALRSRQVGGLPAASDGHSWRRLQRVRFGPGRVPAQVPESVASVIRDGPSGFRWPWPPPFNEKSSVSAGAEQSSSLLTRMIASSASARRKPALVAGGGSRRPPAGGRPNRADARTRSRCPPSIGDAGQGISELAGVVRDAAGIRDEGRALIQGRAEGSRRAARTETVPGRRRRCRRGSHVAGHTHVRRHDRDVEVGQVRLVAFQAAANDGSYPDQLLARRTGVEDELSTMNSRSSLPARPPA